VIHTRLSVCLSGRQAARKLTHAEIAGRQKERPRQDRLPLSVVLNNIRSLHNVGSIFRTCDGVGVEKLWLCGITGYPPNAQIAKTALGAERHVPWEHRLDILSVIQELKTRHYQIVLLEQTTESIPYDDFHPHFPACLVIGNEIEGICASVVPYCDAAIDIEMAGIKNSLNVAVAFGIAACHIRSCLKREGLPDGLVLTS
jgi:tRNA G18 (ribose-2'-O)-methylase SpoU